MEKALDNTLIEKSKEAIEKGKKVSFESPIVNTNRTVGTMLSNEVAKRWEAEGLPEDTIDIKLNGSAGQSLAAWLVKGITITLEGDANDYVGKGLSGGKLIIYPPKSSKFKSEENVLLGNVALYGATSGEAYFRGVAAERFCVRNSGASVVVEGIGDHGCEYMTGGIVVVLGEVGSNFGAGMSGGIAYVYDKNSTFKDNFNSELADINDVKINSKDEKDLIELIKKHQSYTNSSRAKYIIDNWDSEIKSFKKIIPRDYAKILNKLEKSNKEKVNG